MRRNISLLAALLLLVLLAPIAATEAQAPTEPTDDAEPVDQNPAGGVDFSGWTVGDPHVHAAGDAGIGQPRVVGGNVRCAETIAELEERNSLPSNYDQEAECAEEMADEVARLAATSESSPVDLDWVILTEHVPWLGVGYRGEWKREQASRQWNHLRDEAESTSVDSGVRMLMGQEVGTAGAVSTNGHLGVYSGHFIGHSWTVDNENDFIDDIRSAGAWGVINHPNSNDSGNGSFWHCWFDNDEQAARRRSGPCSYPIASNLDTIRGVELLSGHQLASEDTLAQVDALLSIGGQLGFVGSGDVHTTSRGPTGSANRGNIEDIGMRGRTWTNTGGAVTPSSTFDPVAADDPVRQAIKRGATVATTGPLAVPRIDAAMPGDTAFVTTGSKPTIEIYRQFEDNTDLAWAEAEPTAIRIVAGDRYVESCANGPSAACTTTRRATTIYAGDAAIDISANPIVVPVDFEVEDEMWVRVEVHWGGRHPTAGGFQLDDSFFPKDSNGVPLRYEYTTYASPIYLRPTLEVENPSAASATLLVLDVSQSMEGEQIEAAKEGVIKHLQGIDPDTIVGLRVYPSPGANDAEGCSMGRLLIPLAQSDPTSGSLAVSRLTTSRGDTPTSAALRAAVDDLVQLGVGSANLVLISDGESNCPREGLACEVARQLAESTDIDLSVSTVAFDIAEAAGREELRCIAEATGATYVEADNNDELIARAVEFSQPRLELTSPAITEPDVEGSITASLDVSSVGGTPARDARVEMTVTTDDGELRASERQRLGNLGPGQSRTVEWSFIPPVEDEDTDYRFDFTAVADNTGTDQSVGRASETIATESPLVQSSLGGPLAAARNVVVMGDGFADPQSCQLGRVVDGLAFWDRRLSITCPNTTISGLRQPGPLDPTDGPNQSQLEQLAGLSDADAVDAVVVTIGEADLGWLALHHHCFVESGCDQTPVQATCLPADLAVDPDCAIPDSNLAEELRNRAEGMVPSLAQLYSQIDAIINTDERLELRAGRRAPVVVLAYPRLVPESLAGRPSCTTILGPGEVALLNTATSLLNGAIEAAVEQQRGRGEPIFFVADTAAAFGDDHTVCDTDSHLGGLTTLRSETPPVLGGGLAQPADGVATLAPTADGYRAISAALARWSDSAPWNDLVVPAEEPPVIEQPSDTDATPLSLPASTGSAPVSVEPGRSYEVDLGGFRPGSPVGFRLTDGDQLIGTGVAGDDGSVDAVITIPTTAEEGEIELEVRGTGADEQSVATLRSLAVSTPRPLLPLIAVGASALSLAVGAGLLLFRRRIG